MFPGGGAGGGSGLPLGAVLDEAGGGGVPEGPPSENGGGQVQDLTDKIDKQGSYAKNEASGFPMSNLFIGDSRLGCKSDADEQLIIHLAFTEFVRVSVQQSCSAAGACIALAATAGRH